MTNSRVISDKQNVTKRQEIIKVLKMRVNLRPKILIVDDNKIFISDLDLLLKKDFNFKGAFSAEEGLKLLKENIFDALLLDIDLGSGMDGFDILKRIQKEELSIPVIMITKDENITTVVKAIKMGAYDYVGKKPDLSELKIIINRALKEYGLRRSNQLLREEIRRFTGELLGESNAICDVKNQIEKLAKITSTVLITGESGTGKELVARQIHYQSTRRDKPFVAVNCAAIPRELFESEIFGYEKGAFTGALKTKTGKFELANHGTLFLDEISELDTSVQAKLLRILEEKKLERVGGKETISVDVRILAATNKNLKDLIQSGKFREDLYFRLNVIPVYIPPLRERKDDIPVLVKEFVRCKSIEMKKNVKRISPEAMKLLISYDWPGNVRELQNLIERAVIFSENEILTEDLFPSILNSYATLPNYAKAKQQALNRFQHEYVTTMLKIVDGNITKAAEQMGITRQGLQKMLGNLKIR